MVANDITIKALYPKEITLEEVFMDIVKREDKK
jgi:hypothetical protein